MATAVAGKRGTFCEINIVPLIDILLVLLVIFMIIPHTQKGFKAEIPQPAPAGGTPVKSNPIVVQVFADGSLRINQERVTWEPLGSRLEEIYKARNNRVAFVRGEPTIEFQVAARVIDIMVAAGVTSVGLMTPALDQNVSADRILAP